MNPPVEEFLARALQLPESDRAELAASLIDSLDRESDENAEAAWDVEIRRRLAELDSGSVKTVSWAEARRRIVDTPDGSSGA